MNLLDDYKSIYSNEIVNIALFGVDRRNQNESTRSDCMMILTIDYKNKTIKLSSLMRDMYVPIEGHQSNKLNSAYSLGGPQLAIKTINQNFGTNIRNYITVDFFTLEKIIDELGGINLTIKQNELNEINKFAKEVSEIEKKEYIPIISSGFQQVDGLHAVSFARIRHVGDGDFERTKRQRELLSAIINKEKEKGGSHVLYMLPHVFSKIETSLDKKECINLIVSLLKNGEFKIEQKRFPEEGLFKNDMSTGVFYLKVNLNTTKEHIMEYIYNIEKKRIDELRKDLNPGNDINVNIEKDKKTNKQNNEGVNEIIDSLKDLK